jgi:hypothetical protein
MDLLLRQLIPMTFSVFIMHSSQQMQSPLVLGVEGDDGEEQEGSRDNKVDPAATQVIDREEVNREIGGIRNGTWQ